MAYFSRNASLGAQHPSKVAEYLLEIGDEEGSRRLMASSASGQVLAGLLGNDQYLHTGVIVGYIAPGGKGAMAEIVNATQMAADDGLRGHRIKITLDKFFVQSYPGNGHHRILCEFAGKNQVSGETEEMRFALTASASDKGSAAISGKPIFMGVTVGDDGIDFGGRTVNVCSSTDDLILGALGNDSFKNGLSLISSVQPALKPFVSLATNVVNAAASRNKNKQVYAFSLGLDFGNNATSARLRRGSYVVVQGEEGHWDWSKFAWNTDSMSVVAKNTGKSLELNYMVFGVSDFLGAEAPKGKKKA